MKCCIKKDFTTQIKISIACYICVTSARRRDEVANRRKDLNRLQTKTVKHSNNYSSTQFNTPNMATNCATREVIKNERRMTSGSYKCQSNNSGKSSRH